MTIFPPNEWRRRGAALVITLAILVILVILTIGLSETMRLERAAANSHLESSRSADFAAMGVDRVVAELRQWTAATNVGWISSPGQIVSSGTAGSFALSAAHPLHSGAGDTNIADKTLQPANLNVQMLVDQTPRTFLITDRTADPDDPASGIIRLPLQWVYVRADGQWETNQSPNLSNQANPIVGRFAYWADDESTKVNYNIAWKRRNSGLSAGNPSTVNLPSLPGLTETQADMIHGAITTDGYTNVARFFNSPQDARRLGADISAGINTNKFELTHYNADPDLTFFNEPRIVLTTKSELAGGRPYIDIGTGTNAVSVATAIDGGRLTATLNRLLSYMQRTDWPMVNGSSSLQQKYYGGNQQQLTQLALSIVDYVRCKESPATMVVPIRGSWAGANFSVSAGSSDYVGIGRGVLINEVGAHLSTDKRWLTFLVELYLPENYGIDEINFDTFSLSLATIYEILNKNTNASLVAWQPGHRIGNPGVWNATDVCTVNGSPSKILRAGEYMLVKRTFDLSGDASKLAGTPRNDLAMLVRVGIGLKDTDDRIELAPLRGMIPYTLDPDTVAVDHVVSLEVDDARVTRHADDWVHRSSGNTFGEENSIYSVGESPLNVTPPQDTDGNGRVSAASMVMPYPAGSAKNPAGLVTSPGELGYIHTGMKSSFAPGVPWRSLRLLPEGTPSVVPDWAFMDIFAAPVGVPEAGKGILRPDGVGVGGRINMNAQAQPFGDTNHFSQPLERWYPLVAALEGVRFNSGNTNAVLNDTQARNIARNIYTRNFRTPGQLYGYTNAYDSPGEVVEVAGVADGAVTGVRGEEAEELMRGMANVISSRGSVSNIYSIGQTLQQTKNGDLKVRGEQRLQTFVERHVDPATGAVTFRTVYYRILTP